MIGATLGVFDEKRLCDVLEDARRRVEIPIVPLARTLDLEHWMRELQRWEQQRDGGAEAAASHFIIKRGISQKSRLPAFWPERQRHIEAGT